MRIPFRTALYVLAVLCVFGFVAYAQKQQAKPQAHHIPVYYLTAGYFNGLSDDDQTMYTTGLIDGFFGAGLFGASDDTVGELATCTLSMDIEQTKATIVKWVKDHPEHWQYPMAVAAYDALNSTCPGVMKIP